jgi:hypothetical protein
MLASLVLSSSAFAATTAYWRLEEGSAGADVTAALDSSGNGFNQSSRNGDPNYSSNVPGAFIFDPVSGSTVPNALSLDATLANARVNTVNNSAFNTTFTIEMFIQITEEPDSYNSYVRRPGGWQLDFDHSAKTGFGRGRARFDTSDGENENFLVGPTGGAAVPGSSRLYIDTDAGDGLVSSYNDPVDWALDGDGFNDIATWHHVAVTFDQISLEISYYFDYVLAESSTLADIDSSGYLHQDAQIQFGKGGGEYGTFIDEVRYSDGLLAPNQFLIATNIPEPGTAALALIGTIGLLVRRRR